MNKNDNTCQLLVDELKHSIIEFLTGQGVSILNSKELSNELVSTLPTIWKYTGLYLELNKDDHQYKSMMDALSFYIKSFNEDKNSYYVEKISQKFYYKAELINKDGSFNKLVSFESKEIARYLYIQYDEKIVSKLPIQYHILSIKDIVKIIWNIDIKSIEPTRFI